MSAPAIKLRPAPISTIALTDGSALPLSSASTMPCGTPGDSAFTGGLSTVMMPTPLSVSKRTSSPSAISNSLGGLGVLGGKKTFRREGRKGFAEDAKPMELGVERQKILLQI